MVFLKENGTKVHCSGSLVHEKYVLSAGHCFSSKSKHFIPLDKLLVVLSIFDISFAHNPFFQSIHRSIKMVKTHPHYIFPSAYSDVAIVELNETVPLRDSLSTVCLPDISVPDPDDLLNVGGVVVGFGPHRDNATMANQLQQTVFSHASCIHHYSPENAHIDYRSLILKNLPHSFDETLMCAGNLFNSGGTCPGQ